MQAYLAQRDVAPLVELLKTYDDEKDAAKCYATLAYLSCAGAGGGPRLSEDMAEMIEAFYLSTSIHDDALDREDEHVRRRGEFSRNSYVVLGDCFFVRLGVALARAMSRIPEARRDVALDRFERYLHDVAESQIRDEHAHGKVPSTVEAIRQMKLRGGTWGRLCTEIPALAGGLADDEARQLGNAAEELFMALTVRDDLRDLEDDLRNGILTLSPATYFEEVEDRPQELSTTMLPSQLESFIDLLHTEGMVSRALNAGRRYATEGVQRLGAFLDGKEDMNWYLLLMIFRLVEKRFEEFTPSHVRRSQLGIGFSGCRPDGLATIGF